MKNVVFFKGCNLPDNPFSVEQEYIKISDIENGLIPTSHKLDYSDAENDFEDDFDDLCISSAELDNSFEQEIYNDKNFNSDDETEVKDA